VLGERTPPFRIPMRPARESHVFSSFFSYLHIDRTISRSYFLELGEGTSIFHLPVRQAREYNFFSNRY